MNGFTAQLWTIVPRVTTNAEIEPAAIPAGEPLVRVQLVPVEIFGVSPEPCEHCGEETGGGYGLMDAVEAWSDCNRAAGHIFRKDDIPTRHGETITIYVPQSEMPKFEKTYGDPWHE